MKGVDEIISKRENVNSVTGKYIYLCQVLNVRFLGNLMIINLNKIRLVRAHLTDQRLL